MQAFQTIGGTRTENLARTALVANTAVTFTLTEEDSWAAGDTLQIIYKFNSVVGGDTYQEGEFTYTWNPTTDGVVAFAPAAALRSQTRNAQTETTDTVAATTTDRLYEIGGASTRLTQQRSQGLAIKFANIQDYFDTYVEEVSAGRTCYHYSHLEIIKRYRWRT